MSVLESLNIKPMHSLSMKWLITRILQCIKQNIAERTNIAYLIRKSI